MWSKKLTRGGGQGGKGGGERTWGGVGAVPSTGQKGNHRIREGKEMLREEAKGENKNNSLDPALS